MKEEDFTYTCNAEGYTVMYKGKSIGGAGIMGKSKSRGKARIEDIRSYRESAKRDIAGILNGRAYPHMIQAIKQIDDEEAKNNS